jgi:hypothetical protein
VDWTGLVAQLAVRHRSFVRSCDGRDVGHLRLCDWTRRAYAWSSPRGGTRSGSGTRWLIALCLVTLTHRCSVQVVGFGNCRFFFEFSNGLYRCTTNYFEKWCPVPLSIYAQHVFFFQVLQSQTLSY